MNPMMNLPPELQAEALAIQRRQRLADALTQRALGPMQQAQNYGRLASPTSALAPAAQIFQAYAGKQASDRAETDQAAFGEKYRNQLKQSVEDYIKQRDTDSRGAAVGALTSGFPNLEEVGKLDLQAIGKGSVTSKDLLSADGYTSESRVAAALAAQQGHPAPMSLLVRKPEFTSVDGRLVDTGAAGGPTVAGDFARPWVDEQIVGPSGPIAAQREQGTGKLEVVDKTPKITTNVNSNSIMKGPPAGAEEGFKLAARTVDDLGNKARSAQKVQEQLQTMKKLEASGVFSNKTTGVQTFMTNIAQAIGVKLPPEKIKQLANTESFNSVATQMWQDIISQLGGNRNVTAPEAARIEEITPRLANSPEARAELYGILNTIAERSVNRAKAANSAYWEAVNTGDPSKWSGQFERIMLPAAGPESIPDQSKVDAVSGAMTKPATKSRITRMPNGTIVEEVDE
jgi:hypothetical protein